MQENKSHKIQVNISSESNNVLTKLSHKKTKSMFVDFAIKSFAKTKEGKLFLQKEMNE